MTSSTSSAQNIPGLSTSSDAPSSANPPKGEVRDIPRLRPPRSLPPWIGSYEERYGAASEEQLRLLNPPARSVPPKHNGTPDEPQRRVSQDGFVDWEDPKLGPAKGVRGRIPHFFRYGRASMRGRKWDHLRSAEPVIVPAVRGMMAQPATTWGDFVQSSAYGRMPNERSEIVSAEEFDRLQPTFNQTVDIPLHPTDVGASHRRKTKALYKRIWSKVMRSSFSPLLFRLGVMVTSILALGISARIYQIESAWGERSAERTQSIVAIVVDCVAVPFIGYMIWDEYTGKPLGLRSGVSKMSLILLDLFFIIFKSASTALAFESLVYHNRNEAAVRALSKSLAALMFIGLLSWTMNFTVNIFRTVEQLGGGDDEGEWS